MDDGVVVELANHLVVQVTSIAVCLLLGKKLCPNHEDPWYVADLLVSLVVFPLLAAAAIGSVLDLRHTLTSRWTGVTPETRFFLLLYIARCVVHMPVQAMEKMSQKLLIMMTVHHAVSIACFGSGLLTGRMHFWGCLDGCCEVSTVFLNFMYCGKQFSIQDRRLEDLCPTVFAVNGLGLWLSFVIFRIMLFPAWLYYWYRDVVTHPELTWTPCSPMERYIYPSVTVMLLVLSAMWFVPLTKGVRKVVLVLRGLAPPEQEAADDEGFVKLNDKE